MKLYYVVGSPNCRKVLAVVNHLGLSLDIEYLDFFTGDIKQPAYLDTNPNGMVPALRDGDLVLWESNAIMQYLAATAPSNSLLPKDERVRADITRWQCWEIAHYNKALGQLTFETVAKPNFLKMEPDKAIVEISTRELHRHAPVLEAHLKGRAYIVGNNITLADYSMAHLEGFKDAAPFDWSPFPNINAYYERMRAAPQWAQTAPSSAAAVGRKPQSL
jgi:glutathione S-transferase